MWSTLRADLSVAIRSMRRQPVFTAMVVATLAVGIGANTAMFGLVHAALIRPLPYKDPGRLVMARRTLPGRVLMWNSAPDWYDYQAQVPGFETLAGSSIGAFRVTVTGGGRPERVPAMAVSDDLLPALGVRPVAGRLFSAKEGVAGAPQVAIVSERLAERRFGGAQAAVGQALPLVGLGQGGVAATIVGVLPSSFHYLDRAEMWVPIRRGENDGPETRRFHNWILVGRLKPGVSIETVQGQIDLVARRLQQEYPDTNKEKGLRVDPLQATLLGQQAPILAVLMGAVALVLLIACINVAGLLLVRGLARRPEMAVRAALGASRGRIVAQFLAESVLLASVAGVLGVVLAIWLVRLLPAATGLAESGVEVGGLQGSVLLFALAASLATGLLSGVAPALRSSSLRLADHLAPGVRATESRGSTRLRAVLVAAQVALSLVLLVGAGLLVRSLVGLVRTDLGFEIRNLLATSVDLPAGDEESRLRFLSLLHDDLAAIPGVTSVAMTSHMPILEPWGDPPVWPASRPPADSTQEMTAMRRVVTPGFFTTLGVRRLSGRDLLPTDRMDTPRVIVVNEAFAREFFPGENPLGQRVMVAGGESPLDYEVVGIVDNARTDSVRNEAYPSFYVSANQAHLHRANILLRSGLPPEQLTRALRAAAAARDRDIPVDPLARMEALVSGSLASQRVTTITLTTFSIVALLLAALGLYGVLTHYVSQRTHEIGVRMALGAGTANVVAGVLRRGAAMVLPGLVAGVLVSLAATRLIARFLYGVPATDPATYAGVIAGLALVALAASAWPAWRASRVDPVCALRQE